MNERKLILAAAAMLAIVAGCAQKSEVSAVDLAAEEKAIWDRSAEWMTLAQAKDAAAIANTVFLPDAITVFEGRVRKGSAEIQAGMEKEYSDMPDATLAWTTDSVKLASSGDLAWETGAWTLDPDGAGEAAPISGSFVTVWSRVDGVWRVAADSGSSPRQEPEASADATAAPAAG
ncbi:MAG: nuclear transport factor 2 family protein [Steroidobacteraceae bacterium]